MALCRVSAHDAESAFDLKSSHQTTIAGNQVVFVRGSFQLAVVAD
ncbi:hypothetical protein [Pseudomonas viridiflava]|nr:hypothetical protein [Pseudomonas viridiflava]